MDAFIYEAITKVVTLTDEEEEMVRDYAAQEQIELFEAANELYCCGLLDIYERAVEDNFTVEVCGIDDSEEY